jgi:hypothetical protein
MRSRRSGRAVVLAAAAGDGVAIADLAAALDVRSLTAPAARAPSSADVGPMVEALAACARELVVDAAAAWPRPDASLPPALTAGWVAALRHLVAAGAFHLRDARGDALVLEAQLIGGGPEASTPLSWDALVDDELADPAPAMYLRREAWRPLVETRLGRAHIERAPRRLLRVLRGRHELLDLSALELLGDEIEADRGPYDGALFAEIDRVLGLDWRDALAERLLQRLDEGYSADSVREAAWATATDWVLP